MRRFLLILALAGAFAPAALAFSEDAADDGTLSVRGGRGLVHLDVRGVVIAQIDAGSIVVDDPTDGDGVSTVRGAERRRPLSETKKRWRGDDMRARLVGGDWKVTIIGRGIDLCVVGRGSVTLDGRDTLPSGKYSLNDAAYRPVPNERATFTLP